MALGGNFLGPEMLPDGDRVIGSTLDRGVIADHHHLAPVDTPHPGNQPAARNIGIVETQPGQRADFQEWRGRIKEGLHPLSGQKLAALLVPISGPAAAAERRLGNCRFYPLRLVGELFGVPAKLLRPGINSG